VTGAFSRCGRVAVACILAGLVAGCGGDNLPRGHADYAPKITAQTVAPLRVVGKHDAPVPILMYHAIGAAPGGAPYPELYVRDSDFTGQVRWLANHGYHAVTLRRVYDYWHSGRPLPAKPLVLSFDDGYLGDLTVALPVLAQRSWPGVLNLHIGNLAPVRVRKLLRAGWEVDSHTFTHSDLTALSGGRLRRDVAGSRIWIQKVLGVRADFFCYPAGKYDAAVVQAVRDAGYLGATTVEEGLARPSQGLYTLNRIRVNGSDGVAGLARKLEP